MVRFEMTDITLAQVVHMLVVETHLLQAILTVILQLANPLLKQSINKKVKNSQSCLGFSAYSTSRDMVESN